MIKDSGKKLFDMVIVWKLDRFARNRYDSARYKATLKKNGVKVVSAIEIISEGAEGIILESVLLTSNKDHDTVRKIRNYYNDFLGWANEFELANIQRKRTILRQLIDKVEVGKGYEVTVHLNMSYAQFVECSENPLVVTRLKKAG